VSARPRLARLLANAPLSGLSEKSRDDENSNHREGKSQLERSAEHQADGSADAGTRRLLKASLGE
jgi:hypothetical protein